MTWHLAIAAVGAGLATVLGNLQVLIVGFIAWIALGERPSRATLVALPIVLVGVVFISGVIGSGAYGANPVLGVALGIGTAFFYAGYLLTHPARRTRPSPTGRPGGHGDVRRRSSEPCSWASSAVTSTRRPARRACSGSWRTG